MIAKKPGGEKKPSPPMRLALKLAEAMGIVIQGVMDRGGLPARLLGGCFTFCVVALSFLLWPPYLVYKLLKKLGLVGNKKHNAPPTE